MLINKNPSNACYVFVACVADAVGFGFVSHFIIIIFFFIEKKKKPLRIEPYFFLPTKGFLSMTIPWDFLRRVAFLVLCLPLLVYALTHSMDKPPHDIPWWHSFLEIVLTFALIADLSWRWFRERGNFWSSRLNIAEGVIACFCVASLCVHLWVITDLDGIALMISFTLQFARALIFAGRPSTSQGPLSEITLSVFSDPQTFHLTQGVEQQQGECGTLGNDDCEGLEGEELDAQKSIRELLGVR